MTTTTKIRVIDELMEKASQALAQTRYFEAERLAMKAIGMARESRDYERMGRIVLPLQEARRQRYQLALEQGPVRHITEPILEETVVEPGCWLVKAPMVGADARRYRVAAFQQEVPFSVVCCEPLTQLGQVPIVAVGIGEAVRTRIDPPEAWDEGDLDALPSLEWFSGALEALGDAAIESVDPTMEIRRRVALILDRLNAQPASETLHQLLADACREAQETKLMEEQS